jgi:hypothetical protein
LDELFISISLILDTKWPAKAKLSPYAFNAVLGDLARALKEKGLKQTTINAAVEMAKLWYKRGPKYMATHMAKECARNTLDRLNTPTLLEENYPEPTNTSLVLTEVYSVALYYIFQRGVPGTAAYSFAQVTVEPVFRKLQYVRDSINLEQESLKMEEWDAEIDQQGQQQFEDFGYSGPGF